MSDRGTFTQHFTVPDDAVYNVTLNQYCWISHPASVHPFDAVYEGWCAGWCESKREIERLGQCLKTANEQAEKFEREWYLRGDELEKLQAAQAQAKPIASVTGWHNGRCVIEPLDRSMVIPVGMALYSQTQAQAGDGEAYGRGYHDGRQSNRDQVSEFWYDALEKLAQECEELFIYYKNDREKDAWDSPEYPAALVDAWELLKGFKPGKPAAHVNQQLLGALQTFIQYNEEGAPISFDTDGMWSKAKAAIAAAQEREMERLRLLALKVQPEEIEED